MHHRHAAGDVAQVERLFHGRVAAANHGHFLVAVEEAVTGGAGRDALAGEGRLRLQTQIACRGAGGDDQRVARVGAAVTRQHEGTLRQVRLVDVVEDELGLEALGVGLEARHQLRTLDPVHVGRPVVHLGRCGQLSPLDEAGDQQRLQVGARRIDGGSVAGRAGAQDQQAGMTWGAHREALLG